jgi:CRP-like cAMP-binding protein/Fe-S-cluster-containing hydrogenase component 2
MGASSCVSCGECMITCPTGALVFKEPVAEGPAGQLAGGRGVVAGERVRIAELDRHPLFAGVSRKFLEWNSDSVTRRVFAPGGVICRQGEYAFTAFVLVRGRVGVTVGGAAEAGGAGGGLRAFARGVSRWLSGTRSVAPRRGERRDRIAIDGGRTLEFVDGRWIDEMTPADVIFGEMACLNHYPRSATIVALEETEVFEINRNVLHMLQRTAASRRVLDRAYRARTLERELGRLALFAGLSADERARCAARLRDRVELVRVDRGQVIFRQGDVAADLFQVRLGFVKVSQRIGGEDRVINYLGPGHSFGEVGLAAALLDPGEAAGPGTAAAGTRSATCTALDDVELVRVRGSDVRALVAEFPAIRAQIRAEAAAVLERDAARRGQTEASLGDFVANGLYSAQKLLVLDLESCTRCDECTRACSDTHEGITRLIREGLRFENFLVASSCRSCLDPYCLVGCPVDAIHRKPREGHPGAVEIVIEDHCIGCGLCSTNCPYGNISMHEVSADDEGRRRLATTCDLCRDLVGPDDDPSCVYACPHNAAFRMSGTQLLEIVSARRGATPA